MKNDIIRLLNTHISDGEKCAILDKMSSHAITPTQISWIIEYIMQTKSFGHCSPRCVDIAGTGGSGLPRLNISTPVSILLARCGLPVAKHGNNAASGRVGSFDVITNMSLPIAINDDDIKYHLHKNNLVFLHAKRIYPILKNVARARQRYGKPTIFNILGPLLHPLMPYAQFIGCSFPDKMDVMMQTARFLERKIIAVVRARDGLDKVSLTGPTDVLLYKNGSVQSITLSPEEFGVSCVQSFADIAGGDLEYNTQIIESIITGSCTTRHVDLVAVNGAFVLRMCDYVDSLTEGMTIIKNAMNAIIY